MSGTQSPNVIDRTTEPTSGEHHQSTRRRRDRGGGPRRLGRWFLVIAAAVAFIAAMLTFTREASAPITVQSDVRSEASQAIDDFVVERLQTHGMPGAAVAVVRGGEVIHLGGYGEADPSGRPVTADTPLLIGSVSKAFTATAVLQLVEDGRLSLDDPVLSQLPTLADDAPEGFDQVTVEQLLTHTSGLSFVPGTAGAERVRNGEDAVQERAVDVLTAASSFPGGLGATAPGERFSYSNGGYSLLAAVIENVTGRTYADHMRESVFGPLGMKRTFADRETPVADELATGHSPWFGQWQPRDLRYDRAGAPMGYIGSTARDLTQFMQAHLGTAHHDVITPGVSALAHRQAVPDGHTGDPMQAGYGMGWFVGELAGQQTVSHSGALGHFATHLNLVPQANDLGVAVLTNASAVAAGQGADYHLGADLTRLLLGEQTQLAEQPLLMTLGLPVIMWSVAAGILALAGHYLAVTLPRLRTSGKKTTPARWLRHVVLPAVGYLSIAVPLLTVFPLGLARHMVPDAGWGLTVAAFLALAWAFLRTGLATNALGFGSRTVTRAEPQPAVAARQTTV